MNPVNKRDLIKIFTKEERRKDLEIDRYVLLCQAYKNKLKKSVDPDTPEWEATWGKLEDARLRIDQLAHEKLSIHLACCELENDLKRQQLYPEPSRKTSIGEAFLAYRDPGITLSRAKI